MKILFDPTTHTYRNEEKEYVSVTKLLSRYKQPFNPDEAALKASRNKKGKWYGLSVAQIKEAWEKESRRSIELGNWYHDQRERDLLEINDLTYDDKPLRIFSSMYDESGYKMAPSQKIDEGIYPEFFLYLPSAGIAGQSDRVTVVNGKIDILDYKTNKEIKRTSFKNYEGISQKMLYPLSHLDDCNYNHYCIQLSIYMYILLRHNPMLLPGTLTLHHVIFEEDIDKDEYGYPVYLKDENGNFIVKEVIPYHLPYLKDEVIALLDHYKNNP